MRGRLLMPLLAVLTALAAAGTASADVTSTLTVSNTMSGTSQHPRAVQVGVDVSSSPSFPAAVSAWVQSVKVSLRDFLVIDSATDQTCSQQQISSDETHCPIGSQIGDGTMDLQVPGGNERVTLKVFKDGSGYDVLFTGQTPLALRAVAAGDLQDYQLGFPVPSVISRPVSGFARLTDLSLRLGLPRPSSPGWIFTTDCPRRAHVGYAVDVEVSGSDGTTLQTTPEVSCFPGSYISPALTLSDGVAGTAAAPKPVSATVAFAPQPAFPADWIGQLYAVRLGFGKGLALGTSPTTPSCTAAQVGANDLACPRGSFAGGGAMREGTDIALTAYNAPGGRSLNILASTPDRYVLVATLDADGRTLTVPIPLAISVPHSTWYGLESFALTLGDTTPSSWLHTVDCPGTWELETALDGGDGWETGTVSASCTAAPVVQPPVNHDAGGGSTPPDGAKVVPDASSEGPVTHPAETSAASAGLLPRFLPTFATSVRRHGSVLGYFHGVAGLDEVPAGATVDVLCVRGCTAHRSFSVRKALKKSTRLLLHRPLAVTARTIVEVRVRRGAATGRSARFTFERVRSVLLAHRIASGCVTSRPPVRPTRCVAAA
jgi:hypothetical protein